MTIEVKKELCTKALVGWFIEEQENRDFRNHDKKRNLLFLWKGGFV